MNNYEIFSKFKTAELVELKKKIESDQRRELLEDLEKFIKKRQEKVADIQNYKSSRLNYFDKEKLKDLNKLLRTINIKDLYNLYATSFGSRVFYLPNVIITGETLADVDFFFSNNQNCHIYEGHYNTHQYIKDYLFQLLEKDINTSSVDVFKDYGDKKKIVKLNLVDIASYLAEVKEGTKLILSVGNSVLTTSQKGLKELNSKQEALVSALAFGTTKEKLEAKNYEDCKRLLFLKDGCRKNVVK